MRPKTNVLLFTELVWDTVTQSVTTVRPSLSVTCSLMIWWVCASAFRVGGENKEGLGEQRTVRDLLGSSRWTNMWQAAFGNLLKPLICLWIWNENWKIISFASYSSEPQIECNVYIWPVAGGHFTPSVFCSATSKSIYTSKSYHKSHFLLLCVFVPPSGTPT